MAISVMILSAHAAVRGSIETDVGSQDWEALRKDVVALRHALSEKGAYDFVKDAGTPKLAPHIHSQCWVDWLPEQDVRRRAYEQEKRDFGLDMLGHLETLTSDEIGVGEPIRLQVRAERLVAIAEWLKTSWGYGNYILKHQAEEQALSFIAKMAVNGSCSPQEVRGLLGRVDEHAKSAPMQVAILNEESPHKYSLPATETGSGIQSALGRQWGTHRRAAEKYFKSRIHNKVPLLFEVVKDEEREYAFYVPDRNLGDASVRKYWNQKDHEEVCVYGMYTQRREKIEWILKFREIIGPIPVPDADDLKDEASQERYVGRVNDLWLKKGYPASVKPIGRLVLWICQDRLK